ncbi:hypothetical protein FOFC_11418 [Fusarium oxysporum]|nr:hypothetical protein FOFC_11418 [Fusarium oxysporum]
MQRGFTTNGPEGKVTRHSSRSSWDLGLLRPDKPGSIERKRAGNSPRGCD